jgi:hypothetical protein
VQYDRDLFRQPEEKCNGLYIIVQVLHNVPCFGPMVIGPTLEQHWSNIGATLD